VPTTQAVPTTRAVPLDQLDQAVRPGGSMPRPGRSRRLLRHGLIHLTHH
jgi:hypothetical protein